jgi:staphylococcal nuclease domain-containing protein 1
VTPPPNPNSLIGKNFLGTVVEVASGDSIVIADADTGAERRVTMSSIRAPKMGNERRGIKPEPWAHEAKEFLRTRCVGKRVKVSMEYQRKIPTQGDGPEIVLDMGTVLLPTDQLKGEDNNGVTELNVAEMLVLRGLASVVRHRNDDEDRSLKYDDLMQAEQRAIKGKKGVQNKDKPAPVHHVNDISQNANKSKQFLPFLQRAGTSHAVVDYVLSGHRLKLSVPKEGALISFAIAGVRCPQRDEPGAAEALRFVRHRCAQRDCEIDVEVSFFLYSS